MFDDLGVQSVTVEIAKTRLPQVIQKLEAIQDAVFKFRYLESKSVDMSIEELQTLRYRMDVQQEHMEELLQEIRSLDCVVKDIRSGLVDFIAIRSGVPVWLCFKLGEEGLKYYHGWDDGFRGRQLIDFE